MRASAGCLALGQLECEQHPTPDFQRVLDGLQARGQRFPLIVSEIGVARARGNDQIVVGKFAISELYDASIKIEILHFSEQNLDVATASHDPADGGGNLSGGQSGGCHLIEQGLEGVVILAINQGDPNRIVGEPERCVETTESGANDHNSWNVFAVHPIPSAHLIAHNNLCRESLPLTLVDSRYGCRV